MASTSRNRTVLVAENDVDVLDRVRDVLEDAGLGVLSAGSESEARKILTVHGPTIDVALLDMRMPRTGAAGASAETRGAGLRLARDIRRRSPRIRLVGFSAFEEPETRTWFRDYGYAFIEKALLFEHPGMFVEVLRRASQTRGKKRTPQAFIVHGHDHVLLRQLVSFVKDDLRWQRPKILREQPSLGRTVIEKFEQTAQVVDVVFVLLTPDDVAAPKNAPDDVKRRARQNVVFEAGYFYAMFRRLGGRVILLHKGKVEIPSDLAGMVYIDVSRGIAHAADAIRRELAPFLGW